MDNEVVVFGDFELDLGRRRELRKNGQQVPLTTGEFAVYEGLCPPSACAAVSRQTDGNGPRPRVRSF